MRMTNVLLLVTTLLWTSAAATFAATRFVTTEPVAGEHVVLDTQTNLVWQKNYSQNSEWVQAMSYCESLDYGGESDWRLPNQQELASLVDYHRYKPASAFPDMPSDYFWTSTSFVADASKMFLLNFEKGNVTSGLKTSENQYLIRCVRGES